MKRSLQISAVAALVMFLTACGGGGDSTPEATGSTTTTGGNTSTVPEENLNYEYNGTVPYVPITKEKAYDFLLMGSFGPRSESIDEMAAMGYEAWIDFQLNMPSAYDESYTDANPNHKTYLERYIEVAQLTDDYYGFNQGTIAEYTEPRTAPGEPITNMGTAVKHIFSSPAIFKNVWFDRVLESPDQLRQRVAYALSQILVASGGAQGATAFYDVLAKNAFGNYRDLLIEASFTSQMCYKLTYCGSIGGNANFQPDENYARELMQLFTIGLHRMNIDGTPMKDANGELIPNYDDNDIEALARAFTGWGRWNHGSNGMKCGSWNRISTDITRPICQVDGGRYHDNLDKNVTLSGIGAYTITGGDAHQEMIDVIDMLMTHPNMAPFISRHLIMRLVKSNPTPAYIGRVATVFNDNGAGVKGDLKAVVRAILLDEEAIAVDQRIAKKAKEPILAFTEYLRVFDVSMIPERGRYVFNGNYQGSLGQAPLAAPTVFNFYDNEYVPDSTYFRDNNMVSPELQILDEQGITYMAYKVYESLMNNEISHYTWDRDNIYHISLEAELALAMEVANNAVANDDSITNPQTSFTKAEYRRAAAVALMPYLDKKLTQNRLTTDQKNAIINYVADDLIITRTRSTNALKVVATVVRMIVATDAYTIQN